MNTGYLNDYSSKEDKLGSIPHLSRSSFLLGPFFLNLDGA